jgi:predicted aspartyl protease
MKKQNIYKYKIYGKAMDKIITEIGQPESFVAKIVETGGSRVLTIPKEIVEVNGWDTTTKLRVWVKKVVLPKKEE